jgi:hypothetical protein
MKTTGIEIGEIRIERAVLADTFGVFYQGKYVATEQSLLVLGVIPLEGRSISLERLTQTLSTVKPIKHDALAQIITIIQCDAEQSDALGQLAVQNGITVNDSLRPQYLIGYEVLNPKKLAEMSEYLTYESKCSTIEGVLAGLLELHKKRSYHHALSLDCIWITDTGVKLTHQGLFSVFKKRGLSLKKTEPIQIDPALIQRQRFASPEELLGKLSNHTSDLFAVASIIHEIFIGQLDDPKLTTTAEYERILSAQMPEEWQLFFQKALAIKIRDRYPTAEVMLNAFKALPHFNYSTADKNEDFASDFDILDMEETAQVMPDLIADVEEQTDDFDKTHSELDSSLSQDFNLDLETAVSDPSPDLIFDEDMTEGVDHADSARSTLQLGSIDIQYQLNMAEESFDSPIEVESIKSVTSLEPSESLGPNHAEEIKLPEFALLDHAMNDEEVPISSAPSDQSSSVPDRPFAKTIGFFSGGGEVGSDQFRSLKSQLSPHEVISPKEKSAPNELAFGGADYDDIGFGGAGLDFDQGDQDERTFLEFSDVDDQTVFEEDQDFVVSQSHKTEAGLINNSLDRQPASPRKQQTMAFFSSADLDVGGELLQTPDFLSELDSDQDPSRVLPIPSKTSGQVNAPVINRNLVNEKPLNSSLRVEENIQVPLPFSRGGEAIAPMSSPILPKRSEPLPNNRTSSILGDAHDWPGQSDPQLVYTPPSNQITPNRDGRRAAKMKEGRSLSSRIAGIILPIFLVASGAIAVYWTSSNWTLVLKLIATEAPEKLSISTFPAEMQLVINNTPIKDKSPLVYSMRGAHSVGDQLPIRFLWNRKIHNESVTLSVGTMSVYFLAEKPKRKKSKYRRRSKPKIKAFAKAYIETPGESLQVMLNDQPIGQTPMVIISEKDKEVSLKLIGPGIEKSLTITPDNTDKSKVSIPISIENIQP